MLWPYIGNIGVYRCPRTRDKDMGRPRYRYYEAATYQAFASANGGQVEGTFVRGSSVTKRRGLRVGKTVLRLRNLRDIVSPGAAQRGVFLDVGGESAGSFTVQYLTPEYEGAFPKHHDKGTTFSMADGHAEYWKWKGTETLSPQRQDGGNGRRYKPLTEDGLFDLQRVQRAMWGRIGYLMDNDTSP